MPLILRHVLCVSSMLAPEPSLKKTPLISVSEQVRSSLVAVCDDTVYWPRTFLRQSVLPFEDPGVGIVTTGKVARRNDYGCFSWAGFWNFVGCVYLARRNFDQVSINSIDGGISTVSGRSFVARTNILADPAYQQAYLNEYFFFGKVGPLDAGEDKFTTQWMMNKAWKIQVQHSREATIETDLGTYPKYLHQLLRWSRTSWRSNLHRLVCEPEHVISQPWSFYAVYLQSLTNVTLLYDSTLVLTLWQGLQRSTSFEVVSQSTTLVALVVWIIISKLVKLIPHFTKFPKDVVYIPGYILFTYYYSLQKVYSLFTCYDITWKSRPGVDNLAPSDKTISVRKKSDK